MICVYSQKKIGRIHNFWNNIHFHPTDAIEDQWGQRILDEISLSRAAEMVRMYTMLEDIVTEDCEGVLHYDFTLNDLRLDYMLSRGFRIFLSYNFIPVCIASEPEETNNVSKNSTRYKGKMINTSKPKDYAKWKEICRKYTEHIVERYGLEEVSKWRLQCFNEPDIPVFFMKHGTLEEREKEYLKLYKAFAEGVSQVSPLLNIGGPALAYNLDFLEFFLQAVQNEKLKMDFVCFHNYPTNPDGLNRGTNPLDVEHSVQRHLERQRMIEKYCPENIEIYVDEWGAASNGYHNMEECPAFIYRETSAFAAYYGKMVTKFLDQGLKVDGMMICLSGQHEMKQNFTGFRNFFTLDFVPKPIYQAYVMLRRLAEIRVEATTDQRNASVLACRAASGKHTILISYAARHFDQALPELHDIIRIEGVRNVHTAKLTIVDEHHCNPYGLYCEKSMQEPLNDLQIAMLQEEAMLKPEVIPVREEDGVAEIPISLTNNALALIEI